MKSFEEYFYEFKIEPGKPSDICDIIPIIDKQLEFFTNETFGIASLLKRCEMAGEQPKKIAEILKEFSIKMIEYIDEIYKLECLTYECAERLNMFEMRQDYLNHPRKLDINIINVNIDSNKTVLHINEWKELRLALKLYLDNSRMSLFKILETKDNIGSIWKGSLYNEFSATIDNIISDFRNPHAMLKDYYDELDMKIKNLEN